MAPNGNIYFPEKHPFYTNDFSLAGIWGKALFIHEMTHVFQFQQSGGIHLGLQRSIFADLDADYYDYGKLSNITNFYNLNIEQ